MIKKLFFTSLLITTSLVEAEISEAVLAGGHYWALEAELKKIPGVLEVINGFDGGKELEPSLEIVNQGKTTYAYAVRVIFDAATLPYSKLLETYWHLIIPTQKNGAFCYEGSQYRSVIFYLNENQQSAAIESKNALQKHIGTIYTEILPSTQFYAADGKEQAYSSNHPIRYWFYKRRCGYDKTRKAFWH